jgi:hypothetical protein
MIFSNLEDCLFALNIIFWVIGIIVTISHFLR